MSEITVTSDLDFAAAVAQANENPGADTIRFDPSVSFVTLGEVLSITDHLTIDGDFNGDGISDVVIRPHREDGLAPDGEVPITIAAGANVTIRNVDFIGGRDFEYNPDPRGAEGTTGTQATVTPATGLDGASANGDATPGGPGEDGVEGRDHVGALRNFGNLTLERVGFGDNRAEGQPGGWGGIGGTGGRAGGYDGGEDDNKYDTPRPEPRWDEHRDWIFEDQPNTGSVALPGGIGGQGGPGAMGGTGGRGGDGGDAAGAVLNEGTLTLRDVVFSGRLTSGTVTDGNFAEGGHGGRGGNGGWGGASSGGNGGNSGLEWSRLWAVSYQSGLDTRGAFYLEFIPSEAGPGGASGLGGTGGTGGRAGDGGDAATIINRGTITGAAAGGGEATAGEGDWEGGGGHGGYSHPGRGGDIFESWHEAFNDGNPSGPSDAVAEFAAHEEYLRVVGSAKPSDYELYRTGETAPDGAAGDEGPRGENGQEADAGLASPGLLNQDGATGEVALGGSLIYVHGMGQADGTGALSFNIIRIGDTSAEAQVSWRIVGDGPNAANGADFAGDGLPSGTVTLAAATEAAADAASDGNVQTVRIGVVADALDEAPEGYRFELTEARGGILGTSTVSGTILDAGSGSAGPIMGTPGPDTLTGTAGADEIIGLDGADRLLGEAGNDTLEGGDGPDTINGGDGDDLIRGGDTDADRRDVIYGGAGNDSIDAGHGNDLVYGQGGNDTIAGGFGADELQGQDGDDVITGSAFGDIVFGNAGDDFVNGGFGHDLINGGTGADKFFHTGGTAEQMEGHGSDWVQDYSASEGDVLVFGGSGNASQFQVNLTHTANKDTGERSGDDDVQEAFVIYRPTGQILWALVDGGGEASINLQIGAEVFDLLG